MAMTKNERRFYWAVQDSLFLTMTYLAVVDGIGWANVVLNVYLWIMIVSMGLIALGTWAHNFLVAQGHRDKNELTVLDQLRAKGVSVPPLLMAFVDAIVFGAALSVGWYWTAAAAFSMIIFEIVVFDKRAVAAAVARKNEFEMMAEKN